MRLLSLDYDPVFEGNATRGSFKGDISVFDFDVVIWDPAASLYEYIDYGKEPYRGLPSLSGDASVRIASDALRRQDEFLEFVQSGRTLVVITRPPQECYVDTGERTFSGTGRNRATTINVRKFDLLDTLAPLCKGASFQRGSGDRIDLDGNGPITHLLRKYKDRLRYSAFISNPPGTTLAHVSGTDRVVASIHRCEGGGHLVLLPHIDLEAEYDESSEYIEVEESDEDWNDYIENAPEFQIDLLDAIQQLSGSKVTSRPSWSSRYSTLAQQTLNAEITTQQEAVEKARTELFDLMQKRQEAEARDQLYLGTGRALELEVKEVLELLGGDVTEPEPGRDDWKVTFPEGCAVVEVKGLKKSAAEKHAAQLEKWVASTIEGDGSTAKGILVVNAWRETPLSDRTEEDFPDQMIGYSKAREHCLATGLQFFVIRSEIEADPSRAEFWRKKLLATSGRLAGAKNWRKFIKEVVPKEVKS